MRPAIRRALLPLLLAATALRAAPSNDILELRGQHDDARRPDILFLAPIPTAPAAEYQAAFALAEAAGATLPNGPLSALDFYFGGALPVLNAAGYRFIRVNEEDWTTACKRLAETFRLRAQSRTEDRLDLDPLCATLIAPASPKALADALPDLLKIDALIFLAPQRNAHSKLGTLPLVVIWRHVIWPGNRDLSAIRPENWVPTMADIVRLPPPAEIEAVSIFPLLTSVGHQRPLTPPDLSAGTAGDSAKRLHTMLSHYVDLRADIPWVPDFTDAAAIRALEWDFIQSPLPLPAAACASLTPSATRQGFYVRTLQSSLSLTFPPEVSVVIRVKGRPVLSVWQPQEPTHWELATPAPTPIELFIVTPPDFDPAALPIFEQPPPESTEKTPVRSP